MRYLVLILVLSGCATFLPNPPTLERSMKIYEHIERRLGLKSIGSPAPIFMHDGNTYFAVDGNGGGIIMLNHNYTQGMLAHEICHSVQHNHGLPLLERECIEMDLLYSMARPWFPVRRQ